MFVPALSSSLAFGIGQRTHPHSCASHPDAHPMRIERGASHLLAKTDLDKAVEAILLGLGSAHDLKILLEFVRWGDR